MRCVHTVCISSNATQGVVPSHVTFSFRPQIFNIFQLLYTFNTYKATKIRKLNLNSLRSTHIWKNQSIKSTYRSVSPAYESEVAAEARHPETMCSEVVRATLVYLTHVRFNFHSVSVLFSPSNNGSWEVVHRRGGLGATDDHPDARWGGFLVEIREKWANFLGDGGRKGDAVDVSWGEIVLFFFFFAFVWSLFLISIFERGIVRASMWIGILFVLNSTKSQYYETSYAFHQTWIKGKTWNSYMESGIECLISLNDWWDTLMSVCICVYLAFVETISNYLPELSIQQGIE